MPLLQPPEDCRDCEGEIDLLEVDCNELTTSQASQFWRENFLYNKPHRISQDELSDRIRYLNLPKDQTELLESRPKQWNLLQTDVKISFYRNLQWT